MPRPGREVTCVETRYRLACSLEQLDELERRGLLQRVKRGRVRRYFERDVCALQRRMVLLDIPEGITLEAWLSAYALEAVHLDGRQVRRALELVARSPQLRRQAWPELDELEP